MKLIVGLGNPEIKYEHTRHNLGFLAVKALAEQYRGIWRKSAVTEALSAKIKIDDQDCSLILPLTYMNNSGAAVKKSLVKSEIPLEDLLIVYDDMDVDFGALRLRAHGRAGGHNGVGSIIDHLGSNNFSRLRLGIGKPKAGGEAIDYVLSNFTTGEAKALPGFINQSLDCVHSWVTAGTAKTMNQFNSRGKEE